MTITLLRTTVIPILLGDSSVAIPDAILRSSAAISGGLFVVNHYSLPPGVNPGFSVMSVLEFRGNLPIWLNKEDRVMTCIEFYSLQYWLAKVVME